MRHLHAHGRLHGILNGIDPEVWDPATDQVLPNNYSASNLAGKANCRSSLLQKSGLESNPHAPIFGMVTRISSQKGFDILLGAAQQILDTGSTLIVQGLGEPHLIEALRALESSHPTQVKFFELYDADLAQLVYAGSDAFLMPSAFEPCGLGQMFAMRYGTIPVVRHTGGLADTVFEDHNGFVFEDHTAEALANAIKRCVHAFSDKKYWAQLQQSGMIADYSWAKSALEYQKLYELAKSDRAQFLALAANSVSSL
jgi:starch synthase